MWRASGPMREQAYVRDRYRGQTKPFISEQEHTQTHTYDVRERMFLSFQALYPLSSVLLYGSVDRESPKIILANARSPLSCDARRRRSCSAHANGQ